MNRLSHNITPYFQIFAMCMMVGNVDAALYKWLDGEGNTQYSEKRPVGEVYEEINPPPKIDTDGAINSFEDKQKKAADLEGKKKEEAELARIDAENAQRKKDNCQLARDRLANYSKPDVIIIQDDGSRKQVKKAQRQEQIGIANEMIKEFCN